jgi:UDP-glucuronate 4-epimerase
MAVLITGGAGFIGSALARKLNHAQQEIILLDNLDPYYDTAVKHQRLKAFEDHPNIHFIKGDIRDGALVEKLFSDYAISEVAHLASMAGVRFSVEQAELYFDVNTMGTLKLLEAARKHGTKQFVLASTSSVYGKTSQVPFIETDPADHPLAPYPASKRAAEIMAYPYFNLFGVNITCLRFFNVYGPLGRPDMMPYKVMRAIHDQQPIILFNGGDIHRDWTYVEDIVDGVIAALYKPMGYEIINLGFGSPLSMIDFVAYLEQLSGRTVARIHKPMPESEPPITYCDNQKARTLLGFQPKIDIYAGLDRMWEWFSSTHA